jgi:hypothetical protein
MQIGIEGGGMMRGNMTISRCIAKVGGVMRADARWRWCNRGNATFSHCVNEGGGATMMIGDARWSQCNEK